ncbi:uncharacterized protein UTRI_04028_B [Ustilago trichophora]|uniref:YMC020W-like alpha/beta hydrolase domain-containing protein n=1 Tax=Ustilago trichophora TaxID=86804 RepID=A0A5C3EAS5_9BASI|nr:uncharacterized protein UTRI_04028_B [Ustilago trichophora]
MPFAWTTTPSTSAAPSDRITSTSPTQTRGHRRGLPHTASMSSNLSTSTSARGSTLSSSYQPPPLSMPKSSTSAALTNADESDDFRRFLDEAQAKDDRSRQRQARNLAPTPHRGGGAAESLRRVASSSTLNSAHSLRNAPPGSGRARERDTSTLAAPARSVSNYSVTFRNPTSQFLEQLSVDAQTPELGIDDTPVSGRTVDSKSHLTALGHAAQVQSRSASGSHISRNSTVKGKPPTHVTPVRSSTIAVDTPSATSSRITQTLARSPPAAAPTNTLRITSPPRRRPQSYIHKPPAESAGLVSPRKLGVSGLGHGLPTSPKRSAHEMERSSSLQSAKMDETKGDEAAKVEQSPSQSVARRKTWFGLGWQGDAGEQIPAKEIEAKDEVMEQVKSMDDQPPPPMNEEEAAFRRALGYNVVYDPSKSTKDTADGPKAFPTGRDSDATIKAEPSVTQIPVRERRVSWLPWRNVAPPTAAAEEEATAASEGAAPDHVQTPIPEAIPEAAQDEPTPTVAQDLLEPVTQDEGENTVTYRTVVKRGWMGARYEVQEPMPGLRDVFDPPTDQTPQPQTVPTSAPSDATVQVAEAQPGESQVSYPPVEATEDNARQGSATWRWRFWSGQEGQPEAGASSVAQELEVPANTQMDAAKDSTQASLGEEAAVPMDIDQDGPPPEAPTAPEGGSWTYSSYLASWVPTWVYNAQQQEAATNADGNDDQDGSTTPKQDADTTSQVLPRTPAEQVKADALARDASAAIFDANKAVLNSTTKSGWIKFFGSRSANLPREAPEAITNDDGMEVMDISEMEGPARPATARTIASSNGRLTPDPSRAPRARTATGGSLAGSKASSLANETVTPLSTSKDSIRNLGKAAITKAANATAASTIGLGKGKRADAAQGSSNARNGGSSSQPAKDISKGLAPNGNGPSRSGTSTPTKSAGDPAPVAPPNLVLPSFEDTFTRAPRMWAPKVGVLERTLSAVNSYLFSKVPDLERMKRPTRFSSYGETNLGSSASSFKGSAVSFAGVKPTQRLAGKAKATGTGSSKDKGVGTALKEVAESAQRLPRAWSTVGMHDRAQTKGTAGIGKIVVIGVHGWFTQSIFKNMIGEQTGTSAKFAAMQTESIRRHFLEAGLELNPEAITAISLQGDGKVADRVDRLFAELISRPNWVHDLNTADAVFLSAHSQGAIVATQLLARLIEQRHVLAEDTRICLLAMCGIHHGPFAHLKSSITASYINYFETAAAKELFEFQSSSSVVYQQYTAALKIILDAGTKCVYVGSTDDNVVPIYSALNSSNNHPSILRALYIDGQAFPKVDFLTNLLVLCVAVRNAGLADHNLLTLLSASVAGSLYGGKGHSLVYEERAVYDLATRYLFETTHPLAEPTFAPGPTGVTTKVHSHANASSSNRKASSGDLDPEKTAVLVSEGFEAQRWNPYELPWALRGLFEDKHIRSLFAEDMLNLLQSYEDWRPDAKNKALKDLQWRLAPLASIKPPPIEGEGAEDEAAMADREKGKGSKL